MYTAANKMPVSKPKKVTVHPIVLLSVVDHFNRIKKISNQRRVVGILLGSWYKGTVDIATSFAVPFDEDEKDSSVWFLDHDYLQIMFAMFRKVNARERVVGWYHTGPKLHRNDLAIHSLVAEYCPKPVLVIVDPEPKDLGLPTDAYYTVEEVHDDGTPTSKTFEHVPSEMGAEEAEEVGVEHLLRDIQDKTVGTLSQQISSQVASLRGLLTHLEGIRGYLERVKLGRLPINHSILYVLQDIFNLLPNLNLDEFTRSLTVKTNDQLLVVYLASLIRSVIALHSLILNKISNHEAEKAEATGTSSSSTGKKKDGKEQDKPGKEKEKEKEKEKGKDSSSKDSTSAEKKQGSPGDKK